MWSPVSSWQSMFGLHLLKQSVFSSCSNISRIPGMWNSWKPPENFLFCSLRFAFECVCVCDALWMPEGNLSLIRSLTFFVHVLQILTRRKPELQVYIFNCMYHKISSYIPPWKVAFPSRVNVLQWRAVNRLALDSATIDSPLVAIQIWDFCH